MDTKPNLVELIAPLSLHKRSCWRSETRSRGRSPFQFDNNIRSAPCTVLWPAVSTIRMVGAEMLSAADQDEERFMFSRGAFGVKTRRRRPGSIKATPNAIDGFFHADPAKVRVMKCIGQFVTDGYTEWDVLDNGDIQLRFNTGETFLLTETAIVRLA